MKPEQRGQRRAQFVAGIGDEIGAHLLDPAQRRQIVERHQQQFGLGAVALRQGHRRDEGLEPAVERHALEEFDALLLAPLPARRIASTSSGMRSAIERWLAAAQRRCNAARRRVEGDDASLAVEHDGRLRQAADQRLDEPDAGGPGCRAAAAMAAPTPARRFALATARPIRARRYYARRRASRRSGRPAYPCRCRRCHWPSCNAALVPHRVIGTASGLYQTLDFRVSPALSSSVRSGSMTLCTGCRSSFGRVPRRLSHNSRMPRMTTAIANGTR